MEKDNFTLPVKLKMNKSEISAWRRGDLLRPFIGRYNTKTWSIEISSIYIDAISIRVNAYNGICFGKFELDNGVIQTGESYYPIMRFYNKLSCYENGCWTTSDTLSTSVNFGNADTCELNIELIIAAIEESWNKVIEFLKPV